METRTNCPISCNKPKQSERLPEHCSAIILPGNCLNIASKLPGIFFVKNIYPRKFVKNLIQKIVVELYQSKPPRSKWSF